MARKPTRFDWVRDAEEPVTPRVDRPTNRDRQAHANRADALVDRILRLRPDRLAGLPLTDHAREMALAVRAVPSGARGALRRAKLTLGTALRECDLDALSQALDEL